MKFQNTVGALAATLLAAPALGQMSVIPRALGINCRGSTYCADTPVIGSLQAFVNSVDNATMYPSGFQIACVENICAFFQGRNGNGTEAKHLIQRIVDHGCNPCGSAPYLEQANDPSQGILTVNYVEHQCGFMKPSGDAIDGGVCPIFPSQLPSPPK